MKEPFNIFDAFGQVLQSLHGRFQSVVQQPDIKKHIHEESVKTEVISLLESLCGVAEATMVNTVKLIFQFLHPLLQDCVTLLGRILVRNVQIRYMNF